MRSKGASISQQIHKLTLEAIAQQWFAGAVIRIEQDSEAAYEEAFGSALKTGLSQTPMELATKFDIASLTKLFTTTALLKLASEGQLDLEMPLISIADGGVATLLGAQEAAKKQRLTDLLENVTLRALLTHQSGIHYWYPFYAAQENTEVSPENQDEHSAGNRTDHSWDTFGTILETVLARFPRQQNTTIYSDINFMLAGLAIAAVTQLPLHEAIGQLVCEPLGIEHCGYSARKNIGEHALKNSVDSAFAATEFGNRIEMKMVEDLGLHFSGWRPLDEPIVGAPNDGNCHYFFHGVAGHAGIFATAAELCSLGNLYAAAESSNFLSDELRREAIIDHGNGRGLGFQFGVRYSQGCGHTGFTGTSLFVSKERHLSVSILTNRLHVPKPCDIDPFRKAIAELVSSSM